MQRARFAGSLLTRGVIRVTGADATTFLQGTVTNDVHALCAPASSGSAASLYAGVLTPKGKIFADVFLQRFERGGDGRESENGFYIDVDVDKCDEAVAALKRLSLRKKVAIERACDEYGVFVRGPGNPSEGALPPDPRWVGLGSRGVLRRDDKEATTASASAVKAHDEHRIRAGIAEGAGEIGDAYPLECNFDALHGVSFSKGCYMGQENTARQHFRGVVRKRIVPFVIPFETADVVFERGKKIVNDRGDAVGEIITARDGEIGLMRARMNFVRENLAGRATFRVAEAPASSPELVATAPEWWPESYILGSDGHE